MINFQSRTANCAILCEVNDSGEIRKDEKGENGRGWSKKPRGGNDRPV